MVAIPDFDAGAMENWGLITYRETAMLFEPGVSSEGNKESVVSVITHELAHQASYTLSSLRPVSLSFFISLYHLRSSLLRAFPLVYF